MGDLVRLMLPELILIGVACVLLLLGVSAKASARRLAPALALATLAGVFAMQFWATLGDPRGLASDRWNTLQIGSFANYIKLLTAGAGALLVLLAWPTNADATGSRSLDLGHDVGEFFALMLLSLAGVMIVAGANDIVLLFLGIELASIPTYIMVSMSRPIPAAQEAGVKYFFLGAMAAAVMLFGFSYLYGTTGLLKLDQIAATFRGAPLPGAAAADGSLVGAISTPAAGAGATQTAAGGAAANTAAANTDVGDPAVVNTDAGDPSTAAATAGPTVLSEWRMLAVLMLIAGFAFKIAAVPLHAYAGDVYQGAATPVTAFLAFVPKTSGFVALIKLLGVIGGGDWAVPPEISTLLWVLAALTMTVGNVLGLLQTNVKRILAYSSIAHSGYMLVGLTALVSAAGVESNRVSAGRIQLNALQGVLFYLAAYGIMNVGAFGVLMLLPSRAADLNARTRGRDLVPPATTAETLEDLAGQGRRHPALGLAMAICCFSLIGLPLTIGFFGKYYLIQPALQAKLNGLVIITLINAAISAAYYLAIVAAMFLRGDPTTAEALESDIEDASGRQVQAQGGRLRAFPISLAVAASAALTVLFGAVFPATNTLSTQVKQAAAPQAPPVHRLEAQALARESLSG